MTQHVQTPFRCERARHFLAKFPTRFDQQLARRFRESCAVGQMLRCECFRKSSDGCLVDIETFGSHTRSSLSRLQLRKCAIDAVRRPRLATTISKYSAGWEASHIVFCDSQGSVAEIDDARHRISFGRSRKDPTSVCEIDMMRFESQGFLRSGARFPSHLQEVMKTGVANQDKHFLEFFGRDDGVSFARRRLFEMPQRGSLDISLLFGPVESPLHCTTVVAKRPVGERPSIVRLILQVVNESLQMMMAEFTNRQFGRYRIGEALKPLLVPLVGIRGAVRWHQSRNRSTTAKTDSVLTVSGRGAAISW